MGLSNPGGLTGQQSPAETAGQLVREIQERMRKKTPDELAVSASTDDLASELEQYFAQQGEGWHPASTSPPQSAAEKPEANAGIPGIRDMVIERVVDRVLLDWERTGQFTTIHDEILEQLAERVLRRLKAAH